MPYENFEIDLPATFENLDDSVVMVDAEKKIVFFNGAAEKLFGYEAGDVLGRTTEVFYASDEDFVAAGRERYTNSKPPRTDKYIVFYRRKTGGVFAGETLNATIRDAANRPVGFFAIIRDVTERIRTEQEAARAAWMLEDAVETISEGFALYDANDRLVLCNRRYREIYPKSAAAMKPGARFRDVLLHGLEQGEYDNGDLDTGEWLNRRLSSHRDADGRPIEQKLSDGRWLQIRERQTREGGIAGVRADITELKRAQEKLAGAYRDIELLTNSLPVAIAEYDREGTCLFINEIGARWMGGTPETLKGQKTRHRFDKKTQCALRPRIEATLNGEPQHFETTIPYPDGVTRNVIIDYVPKHDGNGDIVSMLLLITDNTARKSIERTLRQLYSITSSRQIDADAKIQMILQLGCTHFHLPLGIVSRIKGDIYEVRYSHSPKGEIKPGTRFELGETYCAHAIRRNEPLAIAHTAESHLGRHPCYRNFRLECYIAMPILIDGELYGTINFTSPAPRGLDFDATDREIIKQFADWIGNEIARERDIRQLEEARAEMERLANVDELTGICNRRSFYRKMEHALSRARHTGTPLSVILFDIDHFKQINDRSGHIAGDRVLIKVARAVNAELAAGEIFGRIGGEEFCIALPGADSDAAFTLAEKIRRKIAAECTPAGKPSIVTVSLGVSSALPDDKEISTLLTRADRALYAAKDMGRDQSCVILQDPKRPANRA